MQRKCLSVVVVLLSLIASAVQGAINKPKLDLREYSAIQLDSGLEVLLVSDPETTVAGAGLTVSVGSDRDPDDVPGLSHLLEHMVFAGSDAYPEQGGFSNYVNRSGGTFNGYTAPDMTSFFFQVGADALDEGLSRFASFLASPSLEPEAVAGEVETIQSEFEGRRMDPAWRALSVFKREINPDHPFARFSLGNAKSYQKIDNAVLTRRLKAWHRRYYVPSRMKLVVIGPSPTSELAEKVREHFQVLASSERKDAVVADTNEVPLIEPSQTPKMLRLQKESDVSRLMLSFSVMPEHQLSRVKPYTFIGRHLTSQSSGRLVPVLREKGWVSDVEVTSRVQTEHYATFDIVLSLTEKGEGARHGVIGQVFAYLEALRNSEELERLYQQQQRQAREQFRHPQKQSVMADLAQLSATLQRYPMEKVLSGPRLMHEFDRGVVISALDALRPSRVIVTHRGDVEHLPEADPASGQSYAAEMVSEGTRARWRDGGTPTSFSIQAKANPFLASSRSVYPLESKSDRPRLLESSEGFRLWHLQDAEFRTPRGQIMLAIESDAVNASQRSPALTQLYLHALHEALNPLSREGTEAGLTLTMQRTNHGMTMGFSGFSAKQPEFVKQVLKNIRSLNMTPTLLRRAKARAALKLSQLRDSQPFRQLMASLQVRLNPGVGEPGPENAVMRQATVEDLSQFHRRFWRRPALDLFVYGNYTPDQARSMGQWVSSSQKGGFKPLANRLPEPGPVSGESESSVMASGAAALLYFGAGDPSKVEEPALLVAQMLHGHVFQAFRQGKEKGYVAFATLTEGYQRRGLVTLLQAPDRAPQAVVSDLQEAKRSFLERLNTLKKPMFEQYKNGLRQALGARKQSLKRYGSYWWSVIRRHGEPLDEAARLEAALEDFSVDDFRVYCRKLLGKDASPLALLASQEQR
ncbi:hypothetical protein CF392_12905 [Tamilnaduibacter salinus]|uniref:Protease 3 n=1 Tax=Tamilnaduibacter salinus TaxID=1484056 RepID=A0A2A2I235_9GAMM|nr:insulinase family protein [Tamilnaduibacter salinus]PAV25063.1 hypothetical protein CF392_12905 [Tamilnaduibacter salinus]